MTIHTKKKLILYTSFLSIILMLIIVKNTLNINNYNKLNIKNGVVDFSDIQYTSQNVYVLNGKWDFYWNELLSDQELNTHEPDATVVIPSVWNNYKIKEGKTQRFGYATYRLHVRNAKKGQTMAMRVSPLATSYRLYIDTKLVAQSGIVGKSEKEAKAAYKLNVFSFTPTSSEFDIIFQISNYTYAKGGLWYTPVIGSTRAVQHIHNYMLYRDLIFCGCYTIILIHSLFIFILRKKEKSYLPFAVMCISIIIRTAVYSSYTISVVFHIYNVGFISRMEYLSLLWMACSYLMLTESQYANIISCRFRKYYSVVILITTVAILLLPVWIFTQGIYIVEAICFIAVIYTIYKLYKAYLLGTYNTLLLTISSSFFVVCSIHDLMIQSNLIPGFVIEYMPLGFMLFMVSEDFILAKNYIQTMENNEEMYRKIEAVTRNEYETNLKFLKSQIKPHFIHNALNSIIAVSRMDVEKSRELLLDFSQYLRNNFDFDNYDQLVTIEYELNFIRSYLSIEKARFGDNLSIEYEVDDTNIRIPFLLLEPLVENAVKHGVCKKISGGKVIIYVKNAGSDVCLGVKDTGPGIDLDKVKEVLAGKSTQRGVGLYNINQRLLKMYNRSLYIEKMTDGGTNIYMYIPGGNVIENRTN